MYLMADRKATRDRIRGLQSDRKVPLVNVMEKLQDIREVSEDGLMHLKNFEGPEIVVETIKKAISLLTEGVRINISFQESLLSLEEESINVTNILKQEITESKNNLEFYNKKRKAESDDDYLNSELPELNQQQQIVDDKDILLSNLQLNIKHIKNENEVVEIKLENEVVEIKLENAEPPPEPELHSDFEQVSDIEPTAKQENDEFVNKKKADNRKKRDIEDPPKKKRKRQKGPIITCELCSKTFEFNYQYKYHMQRHEGERPFKCDKCYKSFGQKGTLKSHIQAAHETERQYKCEVCPKEFYLKSLLESHKYMHTGERPYRCEFCGMGLTKKSYLTKHVRIHKGEKTHVCEICQKSFISTGRLTEHKRSHTDEKPYTCDSCHKSFPRLKTLNRHKLIHSGVKPFKCEICDKSFTRKEHLKVHMNTIHGEAKA